MKQLGKTFVSPNILGSCENSNGLQVLGITEVNGRPSPIKSINRYQACVESVADTQEYKDRRERMNKRLKTICNNCNKCTLIWLPFMYCLKSGNAQEKINK